VLVGEYTPVHTTAEALTLSDAKWEAVHPLGGFSVLVASKGRIRAKEPLLLSTSSLEAIMRR